MLWARRTIEWSTASPPWSSRRCYSIRYRAVPRRARAIGFTSVAGRACFGLYADRAALPDADELAAHLDVSLEELLERSRDHEPVRA